MKSLLLNTIVVVSSLSYFSSGKIAAAEGELSASDPRVLTNLLRDMDEIGLENESVRMRATFSAASRGATAAESSGGAPSQDDLAAQLANPIASLISIPFQNNFDWGAGPDGDGFQYKLNFQPVIPLSINDDWNLITRTIVPLISQTDVAGTEDDPSGTQTGLGDTTLSMWFSPVEPTEGGWIWGLGPVVLFPTGTDSDNFLGGNQWGLGPTLVALRTDGPFTYGTLANHLWNVGGTDGRPELNATYVQPFINYIPGGGWTFQLNSETTYDWTGDQFTVPFNLAVRKMFKIGELDVQGELAGRYYAVKNELGPEWGLRAGLTFLFP